MNIRVACWVNGRQETVWVHSPFYRNMSRESARRSLVDSVNAHFVRKLSVNIDDIEGALDLLRGEDEE